MPTRRAVVYARLSVSSEKSVSIERQVEACNKYAESRGWKVVGTFEDDGVSASTNKPEERQGWGELLATTEKYDAVIIWKLDRLARRARDFLNTAHSLAERKAHIVAVEDPVDMTTAQGRMFTTVLAAFAENEAEIIGARVKDARAKLLRDGRVVGGPVLYGWHNVPNPDGPGLVLAQDPERIDYVRGMVDRAQRGHTIYSIMQWLQEEVGAPTPQTSLRYRKAMAECSLEEWLAEAGPQSPWRYGTVERILRHPTLAGMTPFNDGVIDPKTGKQAKTRGSEVLRNSDGLPVVDHSLAIMSVADWRAMVAKLDDRDSGHSKPRDLRTKTSSLLSGLVWCGEDGVRMHRCVEAQRHGYTCPKCYQTITNFEHIVIAEFLRQKGERVRWTRVEKVVEGGAALLPEIEQRLDELDQLIRQATDRNKRRELQEQQSNLLDLRAAKLEEAPKVSLRYEDAGWFEDAWEAAGEDVEAQRAVLDDAVERIWVRRGKTGRRTEAKVLARLKFDWKVPEDLGPK